MDAIRRFYPDGVILRVKLWKAEPDGTRWVITVHFTAGGKFNVAIGAGESYAAALESLTQNLRARAIRQGVYAGD